MSLRSWAGRRALLWISSLMMVPEFCNLRRGGKLLDTPDRCFMRSFHQIRTLKNSRNALKASARIGGCAGVLSHISLWVGLIAATGLAPLLARAAGAGCKPGDRTRIATSCANAYTVLGGGSFMPWSALVDTSSRRVKILPDLLAARDHQRPLDRRDGARALRESLDHERGVHDQPGFPGLRTGERGRQAPSPGRDRAQFLRSGRPVACEIFPGLRRERTRDRDRGDAGFD